MASLWRCMALQWPIRTSSLYSEQHGSSSLRLAKHKQLDFPNLHQGRSALYRSIQSNLPKRSSPFFHIPSLSRKHGWGVRPIHTRGAAKRAQCFLYTVHFTHLHCSCALPHTRVKISLHAGPIRPIHLLRLKGEQVNARWDSEGKHQRSLGAEYVRHPRAPRG